jgi:hypothetical protein
MAPICGAGSRADRLQRIDSGGRQRRTANSNDEVTLRNGGANPVTLSVYIHGFSTGANSPSASGTLFTWLVGTTDAANTTISGVTTPGSVGVQTHTATFNGLAARTRHWPRQVQQRGHRPRAGARLRAHARGRLTAGSHPQVDEGPARAGLSPFPGAVAAIAAAGHLLAGISVRCTLGLTSAAGFDGP